MPVLFSIDPSQLWQRPGAMGVSLLLVTNYPFWVSELNSAIIDSCKINYRNHVSKSHHPFVCVAENCAEGDMLFLNRGDLMAHMYAYHKEWVCSFCDMVGFDNEIDLITHLRSEHTRQFEFPIGMHPNIKSLGWYWACSRVHCVHLLLWIKRTPQSWLSMWLITSRNSLLSFYHGADFRMPCPEKISNQSASALTSWCSRRFWTKDNIHFTKGNSYQEWVDESW